LRNLLHSYTEAPGADPGNAYGVLQAATHYITHIAARKPQTRLMNAWFGENSKRVQALEAVLLELA
jgi:hypothetical protein